MPATALRVPLARVRLGRLADDKLAQLAASGDERAFEEIYDRHHAALLGFCRHMLGSREEGEDALQQTFLRAHRALVLHGPPGDVRPWLFAIARNRCRSIYAVRKDTVPADADGEPVTDGLAADLEHRADLRALLADIEQLPEDQRSALVLAELADLSHAEIGTVIGVPAAKVKALVHQARTHLIAERDARETPCEQIREQLATARGGELRRGPLRRHLNRCESCREYRRAVGEQRAALGLILPVIPSAGLKDAVLGAIGGGGGSAAAAAGGAAGAASAVSTGGSVGLGAKLAIGAALLGTAGGGTALVEKAVEERAPAAGEKVAAAARPAASKAPAPDDAMAHRTGAPAAVGNGGSTGSSRPGKRKAHAYGKKRNRHRGVRNHGAAAEENSNGKGKALGRNGLAGTQGTTRRSDVQQRNAERKSTRKTTQVERKAARPVHQPAKRQTAATAPSRGQTKKIATATPTPTPVAVPTPAPTVLPEPKTERANGKHADPALP